MSVYSTIIFDFGGVITSSPFEAFNRLEAERGLPQDFVRRINATNPDTNAWAQFERAEIDAATFDSRFAEEANGALRGNDVIACLAGDLRPRMVTALSTLKAKGYAIGCITNNVPAGHGAGMSRSVDTANAIADVLSQFDHLIESSKVGVRKPDPRIYQMMCDALKVAPTNCVYLDDLGINCKPAAVLGMAAIKVTGEGQALDALGQILGVDFD